MHYPGAASTAFIDNLGKIEAQLDGVVDHGSDDDLFIASYLQGHFAVIARQQEMSKDASIRTLDEAVTASLNAAFDNYELEPDDQKKVFGLWQQLLASI
ncbi:YfcL family protein [Alteromonas sp. C1M14]|uniref:YfcL family protein n=1 Tax=Alteromonas sp. C1M14 TaxID=2841567 RepID=UPI001C0A15A4|nr:YfcL family protein [Alteromonas sp. C1M14]MBU2979752.1 YfcL family protein [Alteromonas sp. C1M14]